MFKLMKKDIIVFKPYITYPIIFYLILNLLLSITIVYSKIYPWKFLALMEFLMSATFQIFFIFITIVLCIMFNYLIITKENYPFTLALNVSRKKIYLSKILTGLTFNFIIIILFFSIYYMIYHVLIKSDFNISKTDIILFTANFLIVTAIVHNFGLFSLLLKKVNQQIKMLYQLLILFIYTIVGYFLTTNYNLYNMHRFESRYTNVIILIFLIFVITIFLNFKLVKRVDV